MEFAKAGFNVTGIDVSEDKVAPRQRRRFLHRRHPQRRRSRRWWRPASSAPPPISPPSLELDTINICVPTPLRKTKDPDMSYHRVRLPGDRAAISIAGMLVILESTTYPGTTDELVLPMLRRGGLKVGSDFFLCFSPERVDPGNPKYQTVEHSQSGRRHARRPAPRWDALFYAQALETVVPVSSTQVAEMVKLLENTFRMINIGLVNEIAMMCDRMGINVWEVIDAAATKPFGFMPFYPGPGLGGHCIPIDPFYLSWKTKQAGIEARFIELAGLHQRPDAALRGGQGAERAERRRQAGEGLAAST